MGVGGGAVLQCNTFFTAVKMHYSLFVLAWVFGFCFVFFASAVEKQKPIFNMSAMQTPNVHHATVKSV